MGLFDLFRKKKLPPGDPHTQKAGLKLINKNIESAGRYDAADELSKIGTPEAIYCLLQRFTKVIGGPTPDEDEKAYVRNIIIRAGQAAVEPIVRFLNNREIAGQALEVLKEVTNDERYLDCLLELTGGLDPYFSKYPDKKIQIFRKLGEFTDPRIVEKLQPFLDDDDDDVRIAAVEALAAQTDEDIIRESMIQCLIENHERPRVRQTAFEIFSDRGWTVKGYRKQVEAVLPEAFYMNRKGQILPR